MGFFLGASAAQYALRLDKLKAAEETLMRYASEFGNRPAHTYTMLLIDTHIPASSVPLEGLKPTDTLIIHGVQLDSLEKSGELVSEYPLVMLHGYMNGALYYYRNLVGLTKYFPTVVSLDFLGWGLSSRPAFRPSIENGKSEVKATEDVFVESLEAWRKAQGMEKMVLAGHSMGGYLSIAYCERYPERVDRLILLSPVGVPEDEQAATRKIPSWTWWAVTKLFLWDVTPGSIVRALPGETRGRGYIAQYIDKRLPVVQDMKEKEALTDYLYYNSVAKPSGEKALQRLLTPQAFAKVPMAHRIPSLKIKNVSFLYGAVDWMDAKGGLQVQQMVEADKGNDTKVDVYQIPKAGHLLMLDNWLDFEKGIVMAAGGKAQAGPRKLTPNYNKIPARQGDSASMKVPPPQVVIA